MSNILRQLAEHPMFYCGNEGCKGFCTKCHSGDECPGPCDDRARIVRQAREECDLCLGWGLVEYLDPVTREEVGEPCPGCTPDWQPRQRIGDVLPPLDAIRKLGGGM